MAGSGRLLLALFCNCILATSAPVEDLPQHQSGSDAVLRMPAPADRAQTGRFYMYDLEEKYWWRFPDAHVNCNKSKGYLPGDAHRLSGIGDPVDLDRGIFDTWHFSMFNSLFNRLKRSTRRTLDPERADFFVVPYDMGLDGFIKKQDCSVPEFPMCTPLLVQGVEQVLAQSPQFNRYRGADHVLLWSLGEMHPWPAYCKHLMQRFCANCTLTSYWMHPRQRGEKFISIPFPSSFHYHEALKVLPWTAGRERPLFAVYAGSDITLNPDHTKIRKSVIAMCSAHANCTHITLRHSSTESKVQTVVLTYAQSVFCLCPPGDDPARKALMDILMMGCIPVLMHHSSLHNQFPYHMNESLAKEISVYIAGPKLRYRTIDIFKDVLETITPETILQKQRAIERVAPSLQYSVPPVERLRDRSDTAPWSSPVRDAVDVFIDAMSRRAAFRREGQFTAEPEFAEPAYIMEAKAWNVRYKDIFA